MTMGAARIRALLDEFELAPSRALGQNFVVDPNTVRRIASLAGVEAGDSVLEIGPGLGSLTLALAETGAHVTAVEVDRHLVPVLRSVVREITPSVTVVHGDALAIDLDDLLAGSPSWRLAANLPYNVGTTILIRLLEEAPTLTGGVVLVQREVADRLAAQPGDGSYGIPSVKTAWWASATVVGKVPPTVFHPKPRVESALVALERRDAPGDEPLRRQVFDLVDRAFGQRRKMLRKSLGGIVDPGRFEAAGVASTSRPEELALDDWVRLAR